MESSFHKRARAEGWTPHRLISSYRMRVSSRRSRSGGVSMHAFALVTACRGVCVCGRSRSPCCRRASWAWEWVRVPTARRRWRRERTTTRGGRTSWTLRVTTTTTPRMRTPRATTTEPAQPVFLSAVSRLLCLSQAALSRLVLKHLRCSSVLFRDPGLFSYTLRSRFFTFFTGFLTRSV